MATRIQLRRDTKSNWSTNNPVLAPGEIGIETDDSPARFKIGDGASNWNALKYANSDTTSGS